MRFDSDALDEVCQEMYGHTDWEYIDTPKGKTGVAILFNETPSKEYLDEHEEDEEEDELTQQLFGGLVDINAGDPWTDEVWKTIELAKDPDYIWSTKVNPSWVDQEKEELETLKICPDCDRVLPEEHTRCWSCENKHGREIG